MVTAAITPNNSRLPVADHRLGDREASAGRRFAVRLFVPVTWRNAIRWRRPP